MNATMTARQDLLADLAAHIAQTQAQPVTFVGVDGVDGAGKTHFADELGLAVAQLGRPVIRASADGFHNPRSHRYRQGRHSPRGFFEDSYDYRAMCELLLDPLTPSGTGRYCTVAFDLHRDLALPTVWADAQSDSVLIVDGIFLHRAELRDYWHYSVWLETSLEVSTVRLASREGTSPDPLNSANTRYVEGQCMYLAQCCPQSRATVVVNNDDLAGPFVVTSHGPRP